MNSQLVSYLSFHVLEDRCLMLLLGLSHLQEPLTRFHRFLVTLVGAVCWVYIYLCMWDKLWESVCSAIGVWGT